MIYKRLFQVPQQKDGRSCGLYVAMFHKWLLMRIPRTRTEDISSNLGSQTEELFELVQRGEIDNLRQSSIAQVDR